MIQKAAFLSMLVTGLFLSGAVRADWDPSQPAKWVQPPDLTPEGIDVDMTSPYSLADDFLCTVTGPITDVHLWTSWWHDQLPLEGPLAVMFTLRIYSDIPASQSPSGYSMPGTLLWQRIFQPFDPSVVVRQWSQGSEGWLAPPNEYEPVGDYICWQYNFFLAETSERFVQQGTPDNPIVYWLEVIAQPMGTAVPAKLGWKTSLRHWNDDAVWSPTQLLPKPWYELRYPPLHPKYPESIDLAFVITTAPPKHDLGDAPDSSNSSPIGVPMTAYPKGGPAGVTANYPTVYQIGSPPYGPIHLQPLAIAYLGQAVTLENEADIGPDQDPTNNILPLKDMPDLDLADDGVQPPLCLTRCTPTTFTYTVTVVNPFTQQLYVNAWFDWNRDGDWDDVMSCTQTGDAPEWAVQNQVLVMPAIGLFTFTSPSFLPWHPLDTLGNLPIWMRITLAEQPWQPTIGVGPGWGGSGPASGYQYGETEDYYFVPAQPPKVTAAVSRKIHGLAGTFGVDICAGEVECRKGGPTDVLVTFDRPIQQVSGTNADVTLSSGVVNSLTVAGNTLLIAMSNTTNAQPLIIAFPGIADPTNIACVSQSKVCLRVLLGDANGDGKVNVFDLLAIKNQVNQPVTAANFRMDLTVDGRINVNDLLIAKNALNTVVKGCPIPYCQ